MNGIIIGFAKTLNSHQREGDYGSAINQLRGYHTTIFLGLLYKEWGART